jgi:hypothetical protein
MQSWLTAYVPDPFFFLAVALYLTLLSLFYTLPTYLFSIEVEEAYLDVESKDSTPTRHPLGGDIIYDITRRR